MIIIISVSITMLFSALYFALQLGIISVSYNQDINFEEYNEILNFNQHCTRLMSAYTNEEMQRHAKLISETNNNQKNDHSTLLCMLSV